MPIELTFENVYLDTQSFERVTIRGKLQVHVLKCQLYCHFVRYSYVSSIAISWGRNSQKSVHYSIAYDK